MKLEVTKENLNKALSAVSRVASSRGTLPILNNVLIKAEGNRLSISATNLDIGIICIVSSKISKEGSLTVPARLTQEFIASLPSGVIELNQEDNKLHITLNNYSSTINGISSEEFPVMPEINEGRKISCDSVSFKKALQQVVFAASSDETRPILTGVYLHSFEGWIYLVATDSYRLAERRLQETKEEIQLLIPATACSDILRLIDDSEQTIDIEYNNQQAHFKIGDTELTTRLIDGKYPDYRKLIPQSFSTQATVKKEEFVTLAKVSSLFARETAGSITISVDVDKNTVGIHSVASQLGENTAVAEAETSGEDGDVTINSRFLLDVLSVMNSPTARFSFNGKAEPALIKDPDTNDYLHIIMPLKS